MTSIHTNQEEKAETKGRSPFYTFCTVFGIAIIVAVILALAPLFVPKIFGYGVFHVISGSMEPAIPQESMVITASYTDPNTLEAGDIIAFQLGATVVTHRIVDNNKEEQTFITKGDANKEQDMQPVSYQLLIGKVVCHIPLMGAIQAMLTNVSGKICLFSLLAIGVLLQLIGKKRKR